MPSIYLKPLFEKKSDPVTLILRDIFKENKVQYYHHYLYLIDIKIYGCVE